MTTKTPAAETLTDAIDPRHSPRLAAFSDCEVAVLYRALRTYLDSAVPSSHRTIARALAVEIRRDGFVRDAAAQ